MSDDTVGTVTRCGTVAGWRRHQRNDEKSCDACATARAEYDRRFRDTTDRRRRDRLSAAGQARALRRLKDRHIDEYRELYVEECRRAFEDAGLTYRPRPGLTT